MLSTSRGEEYAAQMASLLQEAGVIEKKASDKKAEELDALAGSILAVADQLDAAGMEEAASRLGSALEAVAKHMPKCPKGDGHCPGCNCGCAHCPCPQEKKAHLDADPSLIVKAASATLIRLADRFDTLGYEDVASGIDGALTAIAEQG